jgi:hypothetical protein
MNAFTKKTLVTALAAAGSFGMVGAANAVNVNPSGLGNVLIYPYYTVNSDANGSAWATLLSVVNTTNSVKAVKIRFREALNSWEVLDFNIFLSPNDVWTGALTAAADGGAQINTFDSSCTIPALATGVNYPFRSSAYTGDGGGDSITRTAEGYFEVFEMADYQSTSVTGKAVIHDATKGVPACGANVNDTQAGNDANSTFGSQGGGLFGTVVLVNANQGGAFTQNATALDNFGSPGYQTTGSTLPDYTSANGFSSQIVDRNSFSSAFFVTTDWGSFGEDAVTAVLMADRVMNEYALDPLTQSATNWILTHPTKYIYVNTTPPAFPPFTAIWNTKTGEACEPVSITEWNREEKANTANDFSPAAGGTELCWEANVIGFSSANIFGSKTFKSVAAPFINGWAQAVFSGNNQFLTSSVGGASSRTSLTGADPTQTTGLDFTYFGLPVIGFAAETFVRANLLINGVNVLASFGSGMPHRKTVTLD